ncbi:MAG: flagellar hook protein FlgE [Rhizobiaceae bacterium]|nr:flagellar hook protein FlgE [Rhizobiaceae bacterium]
MSLYGMMRTGSSGMNAQANRLSTVADNIANSGTTGYKAASTEFSSLLLPSTTGNYNSGSVQTDTRYGISNEGALQYTTSNTDLAIRGNGFFVVQDANGTPYMTRAGSFVPNGSGELVNAGGYKLLGYPYTSEDPTPVVNGYAGLKPISVASGGLVATGSTLGTFFANLKASAEIIDPADLPSATSDETTKYTHKTSVKAFDTLGNQVLYDVYFSKTGDNEWQMSVFNAAGRDETTGAFPYGTDSLVTPPIDLEFDPVTGNLTDASKADAKVILDAAADGGLVPNMKEMTLDFSALTQLNYDFTIRAEVNGNAPSEVKQIQVSSDGIVYAEYQSGDLVPMYRLAMATVQSPDELRVLSGNVFAQSENSGVVILGFPGSNGMGSIVSGALENSTVDIAEELTRMIESQRTYTANSKVFQTGSDLMEVLVNLKR